MNSSNRFIVQKDKHAFKRIPIIQIVKNPNQPRKIFDSEGLRELEQSIRRYGVITPLTVTKREHGYELVAGERRLRAARAAGLDTVPCYIVEASEEDSSIMALIENLQRKDLDFFEEALSLQRLTRLYGLTQQQTAERIGKTQSAVANKLRLLKLWPETVELIRKSGLTERHARALLKIEDEQKQTEVTERIISLKLNVEQTEAYIDDALREKPPVKQQSKQLIVKDVRIFINTVDKAVDTMQKSGIDAEVTREREGDFIVMTLRIPATKKPNVSRETKKAVGIV